MVVRTCALAVLWLVVCSVARPSGTPNDTVGRNASVSVVFVNVTESGAESAISTMAALLPDVHALFALGAHDMGLAEIARRVVNSPHSLAVEQRAGARTKDTYNTLTAMHMAPQAVVVFSDGGQCTADVPLPTILDPQNVHPRMPDGSWDMDARLQSGYVAISADTAKAVLSGVRCLIGRAAFGGLTIASVDTPTVVRPQPVHSTGCPYTATKRFLATPRGMVVLALVVLFVPALAVTGVVYVCRRRSLRTSKVAAAHV